MVMNTHLAYCSGCDRRVRVMVNPKALASGRKPTEKDLICLEHGDTCTGNLCPLFDVPPAEMQERFRSLLDPGGDRTEDA
jgi:hypothetical protein